MMSVFRATSTENYRLPSGRVTTVVAGVAYSFPDGVQPDPTLFVAASLDDGERAKVLNFGTPGEPTAAAVLGPVVAVEPQPLTIGQRIFKRFF